MCVLHRIVLLRLDLIPIDLIGADEAVHLQRVLRRVAVTGKDIVGRQSYTVMHLTGMEERRKPSEVSRYTAH